METRLLAPRTSTSLWTNLKTRQEAVATLDDAARGRRPLVHQRHCEAIDATGATWALQLQIVKRDGRYEAFVDGMLSEADEKNIHRILTHANVQENSQSNTVAFSPCAVSVLVEDGEIVPESCTVHVQQVPIGLDSRTPIGEYQTVGNVRISASSVNDVMSEAAITVYPLRTPRSGTISLFDLSKVYRREQKDILRVFTDVTSSAFSLGARIASEKQKASDVDQFTGGTFKWFMDKLNYGGADDVDEELSTTKSLVAASALVATAAVLWGANPLALFSANVTGVYASLSGAAARRSVMTYAAPAFAALRTTFEAPEKPKPVEVKYTISEFASAIEILGGAFDASMNTDEFEKVAKSSKFDRAFLVLRWLMEAEATGVSAPKGLITKERGLLAPNPVKTDAIVPPMVGSISSQIVVEITDRELCDERAKMVFECGRDDAGILGMVEIGLLNDINRLEHAIARFRTVIQNAISQTPTGWFWDTKKAYWFDHFFLRPVTSLALSAMGFTRTARKKKMLVDEMTNRRRTILTFIQESFVDKFDRPFLLPNSELGQFKTRMEGALGRRAFIPGPPLGVSLEERLKQLEIRGSTVPSSAKAEEVDTRRVWVRELPHVVAQRSKMVFPVSMSADSDFSEVVGENSVTREYSAVSDSARAFSVASRRARITVMANLDDMEATVNRCRFLHMHEELDSTTSAPFGYDEPWPLMLSAAATGIPIDIQLEADAMAVPEHTRLRLELVCSRYKRDVQWDTLGVPNNNQSAAAVSSFCSLLCNELIAQAGLDDASHNIVVVMESATRAACRRALAAADLLKRVTTDRSAAFMSPSDPLFKATQAGRDVHVILVDLRILEERLPKTLVVWMNEIAAQLKAFAARVKTATLKDGTMGALLSIPNSPLVSLFSDPVDGLRAFRRVELIVNSEAFRQIAGEDSQGLSARALSLSASAYASNALDWDARHARGAVPDVEVKLVTPTRPEPQDRCSTLGQLLVRFARLRFDMETKPSTLIDANLAMAFWTAPTQNASEATTTCFYVPFAYGSLPTPLRIDAVSAPLFGTVPVWMDDVLDASEDMAIALQSEAINDSYVIAPVFGPCELHRAGDDSTRKLKHPHFVEFKDRRVRVRAAWSSSDGTPWSPLRTPPTAWEAIQNMTSEFARRCTVFSASVDALVWNVERILQALMLIAADCFATESMEATPCVALEVFDGTDEPGVEAVDAEDDDDVDDTTLPESIGVLRVNARGFARSHLNALRTFLLRVEEETFALWKEALGEKPIPIDPESQTPTPESGRPNGYFVVELVMRDDAVSVKDIDKWVDNAKEYERLFFESFESSPLWGTKKMTPAEKIEYVFLSEPFHFLKIPLPFWKAHTHTHTLTNAHPP